MNITSQSESEMLYIISQRPFIQVNSDAKISKEEWLARFGSLKGFDDYDVDGDGVVDEEEFAIAKTLERAKVTMSYI